MVYSEPDPDADRALIIEADAVEKRFGSVRALDSANLRVASGQVVGLIGPNGAGKTTLMKSIVGLIYPDAGTVRVSGQLVNGQTPREMGALVDRPAFYPYLSGRENLAALAVARDIDRGRVDQHVKEVLALTGLSAVALRRVGGYSTGMRGRLAVAAALLGEPRVIVLDEPGSGLDPDGLAEIRRLIADLAVRRVAVLVSSHLLGEMEQVCDEIAIMSRGRVVAAGPLSGLLGRRTGWELRFESGEVAGRAASLLEPAFQVEITRETVVWARPRAIDDRAGSPLKHLSEAGLLLLEIRETGQSLEDAYFALTASPR